MSPQIRDVERMVEPVMVSEGAGVRLKRTIASRKLDYLDPFLLLDHFGSDNPADYLAGFPMHPHRGIETVTYMLEGFVRHKDSLGNAGTIGPGDVQWMTAGSGIMHEEMPRPDGNRMYGFQLWVNLPAKRKMTRPRYQEFAADKIPEVEGDGGSRVRVVAGEAAGVQGPVREIAISPTYLDVEVPARSTFTHPVERGHTAFAYAFEGQGSFGPNGEVISALSLVIYGDGDRVQVRAGKEPLRFLLVSGKPLHEPVARYGPFVMNTREEIQQALHDLRDGTFVKVQPQTESDSWYGSALLDRKEGDRG
ncbi:MAG: pirin family protein [Anaerolineae bacterium]|nr:pirin family protein [Anaerolineae bacterium]